LAMRAQETRDARVRARGKPHISPVIALMWRHLEKRER
jgi:hypothetical protein